MNSSTKKIENTNLYLDRIKEAYNLKTDKMIAEILNVNQSTISTWRRNGAIDIHLIVQKFENLNYNWLFFEEGPKLRSKTKWDEESTKQYRTILERLKKEEGLPLDAKLEMIDLMISIANAKSLKNADNNQNE